jgi:hypothetical protein
LFELYKTWFLLEIIKFLDYFLEVGVAVVWKSYCGTHLVMRKTSSNQCIDSEQYSRFSFSENDFCNQD